MSDLEAAFEGALRAELRALVTAMLTPPWPPRACPSCGAAPGGRRGLHSHQLTAWCLGCGWARNRPAA